VQARCDWEKHFLSHCTKHATIATVKVAKHMQTWFSVNAVTDTYSPVWYRQSVQFGAPNFF